MKYQVLKKRTRKAIFRPFFDYFPIEIAEIARVVPNFESS